MNRYFIEKRTKEEYALEKWKKKYNFIPTDRSKQSGYITVNGEQYKVYLQGKYKALKDGKPIKLDDLIGNNNNGNSYYRNTDSQGAQIVGDDNHFEKDSILLGKDYFKLKNSKRRDGVLQHEIGHKKLGHTSNPNDEAKQIINTPGRLELLNYANNKIFKRNQNDHTNYQEIEADRYAANKVSSRDLKRGIRELSKLKLKKGGELTEQFRRRISKATHIPKNVLYSSNNSNNSVTNKLISKDLKYRGKALKDQKFISSRIYR